MVTEIRLRGSPAVLARHRSVWLGLAGIVAFILIGILVQLRLLVGVDLFLMQLKQPLGNAVLDRLAEFSALLVSAEFSTAYAGIGAALLWRAGLGRLSLAPLGWLLFESVEVVLKYVVSQPPPPAEFYRRIYYPLTSVVIGGSFPSGHAMRSAFLVVFLSAVVGATLRRAWARPIQVAAVLFGLFCAFSRVYLGYHWPSDVLAGLILGASIALLCVRPVVERLGRNVTTETQRDRRERTEIGIK